jgi:uroporphyrin-III C-methyltransferase
MTGRVTLVGGGPGDPGLLTIAGLDALRSADVVLYDHLVPLASLDECRPGVLLIDVGKLPGGRTTSQQRINELLVEHALAGRHVVRFKGGDPFVFGRGGEEAMACADAGVPIAVVPGVSSSIAGPALAGIPITHRGVVQAFTVVSGHVPPGHASSTTDWAALARAGHTIVVLMGVANLAAISAELMVHGLAATTPAAVLADAWLPTMQTVRGTVGDIAQVAAGVRPPAIVVIGEVAGLDLPVTAPTKGNVNAAQQTTEELRPARESDAGELLVLQRACWMQEAIDNGSLDIPALHENLAAVSAGLQQWETWVLRRDGRLIGSVRARRNETDWSIGRLMVAADMSGQGIGRRLLEHIEAQAPSSVTRFSLFTGERSFRNQRLYQAAGYTVVDGDDPLLPPIPIAVYLVKARAAG